jgi:hypothetical protein
VTALYCQNVRTERYVGEIFVGLYARLRVALSELTVPHLSRPDREKISLRIQGESAKESLILSAPVLETVAVMCYL